MSPCKYIDKTQCNSCTATYHKTCKLFLAEYYKELGKPLFPFKYSLKGATSPSESIWSRDIDVAKSHAWHAAIHRNASIKKLSLSQVLSAVISNLEFDDVIFYIEFDKKPQGDLDKVVSCLRSFIEQQELRGSVLSVYINSSLHANLELPLL